MMAMMGLKPSNDEDEREAILSALDNNHNVEAYIQEHLDEDDFNKDHFYVIDKAFYESWCMNLGFIDGKSYIIKKEKMTVIDNANLLEPLHDHRMREVVYGEDFILVPKYVFLPLSKWYKCTKTIERKVISYKTDRKKSLSVFKKKLTTASGIINSAN